MARDVTEQKRTEERLREAQAFQESLQRQLIFADRMASVGTLAAGVAHEINNPLAYVTANLSLMLDELGEPRAHGADQDWNGLCEMAAEAKEGAERIREIVKALRTFSRANDQRFAVLDVRPLLDRSVDMTANELRPRAQLVKDYQPVPRVEADESSLAQVFLNLLVNAAQAISDGHAASNEVRICTATDPDGNAVIEVHDTGQGIPAGDLPRVFDPFFSTKPVGVGTGLGLFICHNIVAGMGGELSLSSDEGRGTTARVVLPAARSDRPDATIPSPQQTGVACASVLVVDDEPAIGRIIGRILQDHDVTVLTDATEALALLEDGAHFHIIFSDLIMPEMSGPEFFNELTARFPDAAARVVFISGGAFTPNAQAFLDNVSNDVLEKPFSRQEVRDFVRHYAH